MKNFNLRSGLSLVGMKKVPTAAAEIINGIYLNVLWERINLVLCKPIPVSKNMSKNELWLNVKNTG
jgi:hypothetical protein